MNVGLIVIDGQKDFCEGGNLAVTGANADMQRTAQFIRDNMDRLDIQLTLDSHYPFHIAHPLAWIDKDRKHPSPMTLIAEADVCGQNPVWMASNGLAPAPGYKGKSFQQVQEEYIKTLYASQRYPLVIWPYHCIIGTEGQALHADLSAAVIEWETTRRGVAERFTKGSNLFTEHYSAIKAEVPVDFDPLTKVNPHLIDNLAQYDMLLWAGEALDYCLANTFRDTVKELGVDAAKKMVLLEDCTSAVNAPGVEHLAKDFLDEITAQGVRVTTSDKVFTTTV